MCARGLRSGTRQLLLFAVLLGAGANGISPQEADLLPAGAICRMGSVKYLHPDQVDGVSFSQDDRILATACRDRRVRVFDVPEARERQVIGPLRAEIHRLALSPDGHRVAVLAGRSTSVDVTYPVHVVDPGDVSSTVYDTGTGAAMLTLEHSQIPGAFSVEWSPDGTTLAIGCEGGIQYRDAESGSLLWNSDLGY